MGFLDSDPLKQVAIKMLKRDFLNNVTVVAGFADECRRLKEMRHENIVEFIGASENPIEGEDGLADKYLLVECISGGSLAELVTHFGPLFNHTLPQESANAIADYTRQVVEGLK